MGALCSPGCPAARLLTHILDQILCSTPATASALLSSLSETSLSSLYLLLSAAISLAASCIALNNPPRHSLVRPHSHASRTTSPQRRRPRLLYRPNRPSPRLSVFIKTATRVFPAPLSKSPPWLLMF